MDSEMMLGILVEKGYTLSASMEEADLCLLNSCTVKNPSEHSAMGLVQTALGAGKKVVLAGCVPSADQSVLKKGMEDVSLLGVSQIDRVAEAVEETLKGNPVRLLSSNRPLPSVNLPRVRRNPLVEIIPINVGCLGSCTFCKTKAARGKLRSWPVEELVNRALRAVREGVTEVWLTSEDLGAYGLDIGTNVANLLRMIVSALKPFEGVMLHMGMTNPPYIMAHIEAVAEVMLEPNVFEFIHLPVQSGSDAVLERMVREYTIGQFRRLVKGLKERVPRVQIATDIICGFPAEAEKDFAQTLDLVREFEFPFINISQFYARPNTPAARMKKLDSQTVKARSSELTKLFNSYSTNTPEMVGTEERVWFCELDGKYNQTVGHTKQYVKVVLEGRHEELLGKNRMLRIAAVTKWHLVGELLEV